MSWGTAGLLILGWIGGTIAVYLALYLFDKAFKFQDHKGWSDLGRAIMYFFITFVPPVFILLMTIFLKIQGMSRTIFVIISVIVILGFPAYCIGMFVIYPPKRMAKYCMSKAGDYEKTEVSDREILIEYIQRQINLIYNKMYLPFKYQGNEKRAVAYVEAIVDNNRNLFPEISEYEIIPSVFPGWHLMYLFLYFKDGDKRYMILHYKMSRDQNLASYVKDNHDRESQKVFLWKDFRNITMTGRLCYVFMCIENYLVTLYPEADWKKLAFHMWKTTGKSFSYGWPGWNTDMIQYAVNTLMDYEEKYHKDDELSVKKKRINDLMNLIVCVSKTGNDIIHSDDNTAYFYECENKSIETIYEVTRILKEKSIPLPDMEKMSDFIFDRTTVTERGENKEAWGYDIDTKYLSIILKEEK